VSRPISSDPSSLPPLVGGFELLEPLTLDELRLFAVQAKGWFVFQRICSPPVPRHFHLVPCLSESCRRSTSQRSLSFFLPKTISARRPLPINSRDSTCTSTVPSYPSSDLQCRPRGRVSGKSFRASYLVVVSTPCTSSVPTAILTGSYLTFPVLPMRPSSDRDHSLFSKTCRQNQF